MMVSSMRIETSGGSCRVDAVAARLVVLRIVASQFQNILRPNVAGHDDDTVTEVPHTALGVSHPTIIPKFPA